MAQRNKRIAEVPGRVSKSVEESQSDSAATSSNPRKGKPDLNVMLNVLWHKTGTLKGFTATVIAQTVYLLLVTGRLPSDPFLRFRNTAVL